MTDIAHFTGNAPATTDGFIIPPDLQVWRIHWNIGEHVRLTLIRADNDGYVEEIAAGKPFGNNEGEKLFTHKGTFKINVRGTGAYQIFVTSM